MNVMLFSIISKQFLLGIVPVGVHRIREVLLQPTFDKLKSPPTIT